MRVAIALVPTLTTTAKYGTLTLITPRSSQDDDAPRCRRTTQWTLLAKAATASGAGR